MKEEEKLFFKPWLFVHRVNKVPGVVDPCAEDVNIVGVQKLQFSERIERKSG